MGKKYEEALVPLPLESAVVALESGAATVTIDVPFPHTRSHWFAAVEFYSDAAGATKVDPTSGTATFTVKTFVLPNDFQAITDGVIDQSDDNLEVNWTGATVQARCVLASIDGNSADYVKVRLMGYVS